MTLKEFKELTKNMPEDMEISLYTGALYRPLEDVNVKKLWIDGKQVETICIEPKRLEIKSC